MTKITTDFSGFENLTTRLARKQAIYDWWFGTGAYAAAMVLNPARPHLVVRSNLNGLLDTDIADQESFGTWLTKLNAMNDPDKWLHDTLKDGNPGLFVLADDTARLFGPDGVTPVSAPGTAVSLAADDWQGITLGAELLSDPSFDTGSGWVPGTGWSITGGQAVKVAGVSNAITRPATLIAGRAYLVEVDIASVTGTFTLTFSGGTAVFVGSFTSPGVYRVVMVAATGNTGAGVTVPNTASGGAVNSLSVREITNWPAYQNTAAARPTWGRAPAQVRNRVGNTDFSGAVAGTPGTAPTGWTDVQTGGSILAVAADGLLGGNSLTIDCVTARRSFWRQAAGLEANTTVEFSILAEVVSGSLQIGHLVNTSGSPSGAVTTYKLNGVTVPQTEPVPVGTHTVSAVVQFSSNPPVTGTFFFVFGVGAGIGAVTGRTRFWAPQIEVGNARSAYQRRGATPPDITEAGVTSFGVFRIDLSDDAFLAQLALGGTVSVALFGRGSSYLIPSITLGAPSVLALGPLSVLDDGIVVSGSPTGIMRAVSAVPWDTAGNLVGYAIMKANPSAEEQARAMRFFAAHGARGWLREQPNIVSNGDFATDLTGWTGFGSTRTWDAGTISMLSTDDANRGRFFRGSTDLIPKNTLMRWTCDLVSYLGNGSDARLRFGVPGSLNGLSPSAEFNLSVGTNTGFYVSDGQDRIAGVLLAGGTQAGGAGCRVDNFFVYPYTPEF